MELTNDLKCLGTLLKNDLIFQFTLRNLFTQKEMKTFNERIEECDGNSELEQNCMNKVTKTIVKKLRKDKCTEILYDLLVFMFDETHKAESSDESSSESSASSSDSENDEQLGARAVTDSDSESESSGVEETKETELDTNTCAPPNSEASDSESDGKIWCNRDVFKDGSKEV